MNMFAADTRVLVVDDMLTMRKIVSKHVKELGLTDITEADDGANAWPKLEEALTSGKPFGLVLSDWNMPKLSGLDFLKKCRADARFKDLPFMLITAESEKSQVMDAIKSGVSNYIVKPFTGDQLKEKVLAVHKKHFPAVAANG